MKGVKMLNKKIKLLLNSMGELVRLEFFKRDLILFAIIVSLIMSDIIIYIEFDKLKERDYDGNKTTNRIGKIQPDNR